MKGKETEGEGEEEAVRNEGTGKTRNGGEKWSKWCVEESESLSERGKGVDKGERLKRGR